MRKKPRKFRGFFSTIVLANALICALFKSNAVDVCTPATDVSYAAVIDYCTRYDRRDHHPSCSRYPYAVSIVATSVIAVAIASISAAIAAIIAGAINIHMLISSVKPGMTTPVMTAMRECRSRKADG
jgi:hypothetical protein